MTYCKRCGVKLRDDSGSCVLCGSKTEKLDTQSEREYPTIQYSNRMRYLMKVLGMVSVGLVCGSLYLDYVMHSETIWSLIVLGTTIYIWTNFLIARKSFRNTGLMILVQLITVSVLGYVIDYSTGNHGWMLNYVIPFMFIAAQGIITSVVIVKPMLFREYVIYEFIIGIMGILNILLMLLDAVQVYWPYISVCIFSVVILVGTVLLADRKTKQELTKRFHF